MKVLKELGRYAFWVLFDSGMHLWVLLVILFPLMMHRV